ncbi:MAG TPA: hypothetical protein VMR41_04135 [Patescibacteria group bacterium]|jgi:hypothetical protein|nr:hypothetical protein [Patescibacteria group bacterium]
MIAALKYLIKIVIITVPFWKQVPILLSIMWKALRGVLARPGAMFWLAMEPALEFIMELFTGHQGPVSWIMQKILTTMLNTILHISFGVNIQSLINQIPSNVVQYCCYLGLNGAMQALFDGVLSAMVIIIQCEVTLIVIAWKNKQLLRGFRQYYP